MAEAKHHAGFVDKEQQDSVVEALKVEHALHVAAGRKDRADQVAAYAKQLGAVISGRSRSGGEE